jgi:RNA polymerase sigma factor (sigma-70 family)
MPESWKNQDWLEMLRGERGLEYQEDAHNRLGQYLFKVGYNYLLKRRTDVASLQHLALAELTEHASDFVQDVLEKLAKDQFALLQKYRGEGRFLAWAAIILRNHIADRLSLVRNRYFVADPDEIDRGIGTDSPDVAVRGELVGAMFECLNQLSDEARMVLIDRLAYGTPSKVVAARSNTTGNAIDQLVKRSKAKVRKCLEGKGFGPNDLVVLASA